jgi:hypothetical protein
MEDDYRFHEGCEYQLAVRQIQRHFGVSPDRVCPSCSSDHTNTAGMKSSEKTARAKKRAARLS